MALVAGTGGTGATGALAFTSSGIYTNRRREAGKHQREITNTFTGSRVKRSSVPHRARGRGVISAAAPSNRSSPDGAARVTRTRSGGGSCRFWLFPPVDAAVCELLPVCDGVFPGASRGLLFLSTARERRPLSVRAAGATFSMVSTHTRTHKHGSHSSYTHSRLTTITHTETHTPCC